MKRLTEKLTYEIVHDVRDPEACELQHSILPVHFFWKIQINGYEEYFSFEFTFSHSLF